MREVEDALPYKHKAKTITARNFVLPLYFIILQS